MPPLATLRDWLRELVASLREPFDALLAPGQRVFWPFLLTSLAFAYLAFRLAPRRRSFLRWAFAREIWWHPSARLDYRFLLARAVVKTALFAPFALSTIAIAAFVLGGLHRELGRAAPSSFSRGAVTAAFTLVTFLVDDFTRYALHRLMHRVPALWELHKVHHSAQVLTPLTLYRVHPLESFLNQTRGGLSIGVVTGGFLWLFPGRLRGYEILGVDALGFLWSVFGANLRHSHAWLSFGRVLERVLVSPAQHQIHHSVDPRHHERNFGSTLALWDALFGTLYVTGAREHLRFGLPADQRNHGENVVSMLVSPLVAALRSLVPRRLLGKRATTDAEPSTPSE